MTLGRKLLVPSLLLGLVLGTALAWFGWDSSRRARSLERNADAVRAATALAVELDDAVQEEQRQVLSARANAREPDRLRVAESAAAVEEVMAAVRALALAPRAAGVWAEYEATHAALRRVAGEMVATGGSRDPAARELALAKWEILSSRADALLRNFSSYHLRSLHRTVTDLQLRRARALWLAALGTCLGVAVALLFSALLARAVVRPIEAMASAAEAITETGVLSPVGGAGRDDEVGTLARSFNRMTERLVTANAELSLADRRKDEFLGVLSHELRNPLAPIRSSIAILHRAEPGGEQARRAQAVIARQVDHIVRLVDDLLDVTRISSGKIALHRVRVDLGQVVRHAAEDHAALLAGRGVALAVDAPPDPLYVDGDETRLAQIVSNLLHNAGKFTPRGGAVRLTLARHGAEAEIRVRDDGEGIDPELLLHVFEPFVQAEKSLARSDGGLGLGLPLVKGLAELHGGSVRAASAGRGAGAEFAVRLPVAAPATPGPGVQAEPAAPARPVRRVLVVDDNADAAESLAELVALFGHEATVAFDAPSALERARRSPPDFILCDLGMPGMSGYEFARAARAEPALSGARLVALSGYAQPEDRRRSAEAGFDVHLAKPPEPGAIERLLA